MATQKNITSFFKRKSSADGTEEDKNVKKACVDSPPSEGIVPGASAALRLELKELCKTLPVLHPHIGLGWYQALKSEFEKPYFKKLSEFVCGERAKQTIFPRPEHVWSWTQHAPADLKVVILGQDPYHGPGQAHGLCFSVQRGVKSPPSLANMFKELEADVDGFKRPGHGCLVGWARQGVLLLNACLTVQSAKPNSHKDQGWEKLTDAVIKHISGNLDHVVFLLWGAFAQKKGDMVDKTRHHILTSTHPSPLSAHRGFLGCRHFSKCNELLVEHGREPIDWSKLPPE